MPIQLISDGQDLYFFDKSLDQITTVPLSSTPAGILIRKNIDLQNADINVVETTDYKNSFALKLNLRGQEGLGSMSVVFDKKPIKLNSWTVVDATGATTDVSFKGLKEKTKFGKDFFQISRHKTVSTSGGDDFYD
jgi:outer membrane lipoprotein-sorting protein